MAVSRPCPSPLDDEDLLAYEEGVLPPTEAQRVRAHLQECPTCRQLWRETLRIGRLLEETFPLVDHPAACTAVLERLGLPAQDPAWQQTVRRLHPHLRVWRQRREGP